MKYFEESGQVHDLFKMTPIRDRLNAVTKELVADGQTVPPCLEYKVTPTLNIWKS